MTISFFHIFGICIEKVNSLYIEFVDKDVVVDVNNLNYFRYVKNIFCKFVCSIFLYYNNLWKTIKNGCINYYNTV